MRIIFLIIALSFLSMPFAKAQSMVEEEIKKLTRESDNMDTTIKLHRAEKPDSTSKEYQAAINTIAKSREKLMSHQDENAKAIKSLQKEIDELERKKKRALQWETREQELERRKQEIGRSILVMSKLLDVESTNLETRKAVEDAKEKYRTNIDRNVAGFAAYIVSINTMAQEKAAGYNLKESLILLDKDNNSNFTQRLRSGALNIGMITGGILSYDAIKADKTGSAVGYIVAALAIKGADFYMSGKDIIEDRLNAKRTYDAMIRNTLFGDIIREDSANVMRLKNHADSLFQIAKPYIGTHEDSVFIKDDWMPSLSTLNVAETVLDDMKNAVFYWERIITECDYILNEFNPSPVSQRKLKSIKNSAKSAVSSWVYLSEQFAFRISFLKEVHKRDLLRE